MPTSIVCVGDRRYDGIPTQLQFPQYGERKARLIADVGTAGLRCCHPFRHLGQCSIRLLDHQHGHAVKTVAPDDPDPLAVSWMKRIVDLRIPPLISGSMALASPVPGRVIWR